MSRTTTTRASALYSIFLLLPPAMAHMEMSWPYPLRSRYNPENSYESMDHRMTSPLLADGSNFPCKGYQNDENIQITTLYATGGTYNMTLSGAATHEGGSCQLSLSYDNGATFRVIKSIIGDCPLLSTYDFTIPSYAPTGDALLAWTWQNSEGNREYYMNCAAVKVISVMSRRRRRTAYSSFERLPYIWRPSLGGSKECTTEEGEDVVYPRPGPDVFYGAGLDSSSPPSSGDCDAPTSFREDLRKRSDRMNDMPVPAALAIATSATATSSARSVITSAPGFLDDFAAVNPALGAAPPVLHLNNRQVAAESSTMTKSTVTVTRPCPATKSTVTVTRPCPETITVTVTPSAGSTSVVTMTWSSPEPSPTSSFHTTSTSKAASEATTTPTAAASTSRPPYATASSLNSRYLPCVPGTFICTSATTFYTCDYNDGSDTSASSTSYVYDYPRQVAAGMECLTNLTPYASDTEQYAQQQSTPDGYYRDDRYVRARPDGDCDDDGSIQCTDGGQMFDMCDQGGWVQMGSVAAGTTCQNGEIVAS